MGIREQLISSQSFFLGAAHQTSRKLQVRRINRSSLLPFLLTALIWRLVPLRIHTGTLGRCKRSVSLQLAAGQPVLSAYMYVQQNTTQIWGTGEQRNDESHHLHDSGTRCVSLQHGPPPIKTCLLYITRVLR